MVAISNPTSSATDSTISWSTARADESDQPVWSEPFGRVSSNATIRNLSGCEPLPQSPPQQLTEHERRGEQHAGAEAVAAGRPGADHLTDREEPRDRRAVLVAYGERVVDVQTVERDDGDALVEQRVVRRLGDRCRQVDPAERRVDAGSHGRVVLRHGPDQSRRLDPG